MTAIISGEAPLCVREALSAFCDVTELSEYSEISAPMCAHPDMLMLRLGDNIITTEHLFATMREVFEKITACAPKIKLHTINARHEREYPRDAILNGLVFGRRLFIKAHSAPRELIELVASLGYEIVNTKQGYPACTVLKLGDNSAITADRGMYKLLIANGIDTLLIENGCISLPPYEYGFIGGAAGVCGRTVYFMGELEKHPNAEKILKKLQAQGLSHLSLGKGELFDGGGIIFI